MFINCAIKLILFTSIFLNNLLGQATSDQMLDPVDDVVADRLHAAGRYGTYFKKALFPVIIST